MYGPTSVTKNIDLYILVHLSTLNIDPGCFPALHEIETKSREIYSLNKFFLISDDLNTENLTLLKIDLKYRVF